MSEGRLRLATGALALLGVAGYVLILASLWLPRDLGLVAGLVLALTGFGFSLYLTWIELFEIEALCQWCVLSALLMTGLALTTSRRVLI